MDNCRRRLTTISKLPPLAQRLQKALISKGLISVLISNGTRHNTENFAHSKMIKDETKTKKREVTNLSESKRSRRSLLSMILGQTRIP